MPDDRGRLPVERERVERERKDNGRLTAVLR